MRTIVRVIAWSAGALLALSPLAALAARTSLGVFGDWGAFRDAGAGHCYAIATAQPDPRQRERQPFMTVATWPRSGVDGQVHWQLARMPGSSGIVAQIGGQSFRLRAQGPNAWAQDARMDAAVKAAMRSAQSLSVVYRDTKGRRFSDKYLLQGAATAMDAATLGCARQQRQ